MDSGMESTCLLTTEGSEGINNLWDTGEEEEKRKIVSFEYNISTNKESSILLYKMYPLVCVL